MTHSATITDMATRSRYVSTETPQARAQITSAVRAERAADEVAKQARADRNATIRAERAAGVEVRDLVAICRDAGWVNVTRQQIGAIVREGRAAS